MNRIIFSARCVGLLIAFGCSLLLLYQVIGVHHFHHVIQPTIQFDAPTSPLCLEQQRPLMTAGPRLCLSDHNIFFVETAESKFLNPRQACAVESAARHHPAHDVLVLMSPIGSLDFANGAMKVLNSIDNVKVVKVHFASLFKGTPYYDWYVSNVWQKSPYKITHMSDGLRFFLLWTFGGMYLDTDVVVLRPLSSLRNTVVSDNGQNAGSSVMFFDRGHPLVAAFMADFVAHYDPAEFAANGPQLIDRNIRKACRVERLLVEAGGAGCGVDVLPMDRAYPIPYERWKEYFLPSDVVSLAQRFNRSYLIHAWNYLSAGERIVIGRNSVYEVAMRENCPLVYEYAKELKSV